MEITIKPKYIGIPASYLYKSWIRSLSFESEGLENLYNAIENEKHVMLAIWHNELFSLTGFGMLLNLPLVTMASDSKDGQIITEVLERIGYKVARGSSSRGGVKAIMSMVRIMKRDNMIGVITVDGPKGPRHKFKHGILSIARKTDAVIIPTRAENNSAFIFKKSWDKFETPKPFTKVKVRIGKPYRITSSKQNEEGLMRESEELEKLLENL